MKLHVLVHLILFVLIDESWFTSVTYTFVSGTDRSTQYTESDSTPEFENNIDIAHPFAVPVSPLSDQDSQVASQHLSPVAKYILHSNPRLHSAITIDNQLLSTKIQSQHDTIRIYNICSISALPWEITHLIVQFLLMNETDACSRVNVKWRSITQTLMYESWCLKSNAIINKFIIRPKIEQLFGASNLKINLPNDCSSRVLLTIAFTSAKEPVLIRSLYSNIFTVGRTLNTNLKLFWLLEQYRNNNTNQFIISIVNQSVANLTSKYVTDLQRLIYHVVDSTISSIKFDFNTTQNGWCMVADVKTLSIMLEATLHLRVVVMELLLQKSYHDEWNRQSISQHFDNMYSSLKEKAAQYTDFFGNISQRAPPDIANTVEIEYKYFYCRVKRLLSLSKIINKEFENIKTQLTDEVQKNTTWWMAPLVGGVVVAAIIVIVVLAVYFMYLQS